LAKSKTLQGKELESDVSNTPPPVHHVSNVLAPCKLTKLFFRSTLGTCVVETPQLDFKSLRQRFLKKLGSIQSDLGFNEFARSKHF
jgi:hypothetical protein